MCVFFPLLFYTFRSHSRLCWILHLWNWIGLFSFLVAIQRTHNQKICMVVFFVMFSAWESGRLCASFIHKWNNKKKTHNRHILIIKWFEIVSSEECLNAVWLNRNGLLPMTEKKWKRNKKYQKKKDKIKRLLVHRSII